MRLYKEEKKKHETTHTNIQTNIQKPNLFSSERNLATCLSGPMARPNILFKRIVKREVPILYTRTVIGYIRRVWGEQNETNTKNQTNTT